jgi:hypothetical protein
VSAILQYLEGIAVFMGFPLIIFLFLCLPDPDTVYRFMCRLKHRINATKPVSSPEPLLRKRRGVRYKNIERT